MSEIVEKIKSELTGLIDSEKIGAVLGLGNEFKQDGITPVQAIARILNILPKTYVKCFQVPLGSEQHILPKVLAVKPEYLLFIDMIDQGKAPGTFTVITKDELISENNPGVFTKEPGIKKFMVSLPQEIKLVAIGIQGKSIDFGVAQSAELAKAENELIDILEQIGIFKKKE